MVRAVGTILESSGEASDCEVGVNMPVDGWTTWCAGDGHPEQREPDPDWHPICLLGCPAMVLALRGDGTEQPFDPDMERMLREYAESMRPWVDHLLEDQREAKEKAALNTAAFCDPLTGLANRRAVEAEKLAGIYSLIELALDHRVCAADTLGRSSD